MALPIHYAQNQESENNQEETPEVPLYNDVMNFYRENLELLDDTEYKILTSYTLLTYRIEQLQEIPYISFLGASGSGKTRALRSMASLCYNPVLSTSISKSAIYRLLDTQSSTLLIDEFEPEARGSQMMLILNSGYKRGIEVTLSVPDGEGDYRAKSFNVFGPKILASIEPVTGTLRNRCICINMVQGEGMAHRIDMEKADDLRQRLLEFKEDVTESIPDVWGLLEESGIKNRRLMELSNVLVSITPDEYREELLAYFLIEQEQLGVEESIDPFSILFDAVEQVLERSRDNRILVGDVADYFNSSQDWDGPLVSNRQIGAWLTTMGYSRRFRNSSGIGRVIILRIHNRNRRRYGRE